MPTTYAEVYEALSPAGTFAGDIEQSVFENVAERQLAMASTRAAAAATAASTTHSQQLLHQQILQQQQQLATGTSGTAAGRKQQQLQASSAAAVGAQTTAAANNSAPSAAASAAATSTATMYSGGDQHLVSSRPPPVATLLACVAPVAVAQITSRSVLDWILSFFSTSGYHPPPGAFVSVHSAHPPTGRSNGVSGLNATGNSSSSLTATANGKKALTSTLNSFAGMGSGGGGGDDTPRGGGGGNNETTSRADIDALMDGIGSGRQRRLVNTALPRYMARKGADDEITAAIKERTRLRKVADEQKLEALRTEQMLCGLPMARRLNQILASKSPQNAAKVVNRLPEELDIDAVLNSQPPVPKPPSRPSSSNHVDRLSEPKGFALLRSQREPYEVLSSGGSLTDKYMINYDKETPRSSSDVTPIIEGALAHPYPEGPLQKISPRMVALLADPYSIPPKRLHSAKQHGIRYKYKTVVDSWREGSLQRNRTLSLTAGGGGSASGGAQQSQAVDSGDVTAATSSRGEAAAGATSSPGATTTTTTTTTSTTTTVVVYERGDGGQATDDEEGDESAHNHTATTQVMEVTEFTEEL